MVYCVYTVATPLCNRVTRSNLFIHARAWEITPTLLPSLFVHSVSTRLAADDIFESDSTLCCMMDVSDGVKPT